MNDYYKLLNLTNNSNSNDIINAYNNIIKKYNNLPFLSDEEKTQIKELKKAKFILLDDELKYKYDIYINKKNSFSFDEKKRQVDTNVITNRIFSLVGILNIPQQNIDYNRQPSNKS